MTKHERYMLEAISEAKLAATRGEVPIGAIVVHKDKVIARAHNEVETELSATKHAEIIAIERASHAIGNWRLNEADLYVTLEPCTMCMGAAILARVRAIYFGAYDPRMGAAGSIYDLSNFEKLPHKIKTYSSLLETECLELLNDFFKSKR